MNLFQSVDFKSHAGLDLSWKIEMDALEDEEWVTISQMILELSQPFREAIGIPRGGTRLGKITQSIWNWKQDRPNSDCG